MPVPAALREAICGESLALETACPALRSGSTLTSRAILRVRDPLGTSDERKERIQSVTPEGGSERPDFDFVRACLVRDSGSRAGGGDAAGSFDPRLTAIRNPIKKETERSRFRPRRTIAPDVSSYELADGCVTPALCHFDRFTRSFI